MRLDVRSIRTKDYDKNSDIGGENLPCLVCGKDTDTDNAGALLHLCEGGLTLLSSDEPHNESGCLYGYPVGKTCWKKHKKLLEPFVMPN